MFKIASLRRLVLVLSLSLVLAPAASAATSPWSGVLNLLTRVGWGDVNVKAGCSISPDGQPVCSKEARRQGRRLRGTVTPKRGCSIDPGGEVVCHP